VKINICSRTVWFKKIRIERRKRKTRCRMKERKEATEEKKGRRKK